MAYGACSAGEERVDKADHLLVKNKSADALRAQQGFVPCKAKRIDIHLLHVDRDDACALS